MEESLRLPLKRLNEFTPFTCESCSEMCRFFHSYLVEFAETVWFPKNFSCTKEDHPS